MANYKSSSKGELVAIYRLEFYKNKKKWKFCKNERLLKKDIPPKQKLNETYCVDDESPPEVEPPEPLNDAFLETDSDENLKEELKPEPPPPTIRRWKNTLLNLKLTAEDDWAIPDVKAEPGWEPSVEPVRSYEDEWGEDWEERWGDDMQCVEQVYASELCVSGARRSRLPVFAGWPAHAQHAHPNMLQDLMQNYGGRQRNDVADIRQQMDGVGTLGQQVGQLGQNRGQLGQNMAPLGQSSVQLEQNVGQMEQNLGHLGQNAQNFLQSTLRLELNVGQLGHLEQNTHNLGQNIEHPRQNAGHFGQNIVQSAQSYPHHIGQNLRQNTEILDQNPKRNNHEYNEPEILKQNLYQNCKIGEIIEQNLKHDKVDFEPMEWEPERDLCGLGVVGGGGEEEACVGVVGGEGEEEECVGDACVAGAVAALAEAEGWLTGSLKHFYWEPAPGESEVSQWSGDSADFVRGAHARPHSSEVDLAIDSPCECASISANKLAHMSSAALRDTLRVYTMAAQRVLHELRARSHQTNKQQTCALSRDVTHESQPTRDVAPRDTRPHAATPRDMPPGRGRGRLLLTK